MAPAKLRMKLRSNSEGNKEGQSTLARMLSGVPVSGLNRAAPDPKPKEEEYKAMFKNMPKFAANAFEFASVYHTARKPGNWYPEHHVLGISYVPRYGPTSLGPKGFDTHLSQTSALEEEAEAAEAYGDDLRAWLARKQPDDDLPPLSHVLRKMDRRRASADEDSKNNAFIIRDDSDSDNEASLKTRLYKQALKKMAERFEASQWKSNTANRSRGSGNAAPKVAKPTTAPSRKVIRSPGPKSAAASGQRNSKVQNKKGARSRKSSPSSQTARKRPAKQQAPETHGQALPDDGTIDKNVECEGPRETTEALFARLAAEASTEGQEDTVGTATRARRIRKPVDKDGSMS